MSAIRSGRLIFNSKLKEERDYWLNRLSQKIDVSSLRPESERMTRPLGVKDTLSFTIPDETSRKLAQFTNDSPLFLYATLLATLKICLHKYTGNNSIVVGSPTLRANNEAKGRANVLAIIDQVEGARSFQAFLENVYESLNQAYARQDYPFERLIADLEWEENEHGFPLFDIALALENIHDELPNLENDITFRFNNSAEEFRGQVTYQQELFRPETIEQFTRHFINLLKSALESPVTPIRDLEILTDQERYRLVTGWNQTSASYNEEQCVHQLFEAQAVRTPEAVAIVCGEHEITYQELNQRANQLARYLQSLGVGLESHVAICTGRSLEMVVSVLGTLKAGAAYVPFDPDYPAQRLAHMLADSRTEVLLTQSYLLDILPKNDAHKVCLDSEWEKISDYSPAALPDSVDVDNAAYLIYTSGSTGQPKGVLLLHRGLTNLVHAQIRAFDVSPRSRVLQFASFGFDASVSEIFTALCSGAVLDLGPQGTIQWGADITMVLRDAAITVVTLPPALLAVMEVEPLPALETIVSAGEACSPEVVERWGRGRRFINAYGPTENTVCASLLECDEAYARSVPIGRPLANTQLYILNNEFQLLPPMVVGELYIGGTGLARGYLGQPGLTAERFLPDPFSGRSGARLYRSGDLVRAQEDGTLEFIGRCDRQVKVRGFRIELGEVETTIKRMPEVREAVVGLARDEAGLVAYVVTDGVLSGEQIRASLQTQLPSFMVPGQVVLTHRLPLTRHGKVDEVALQALAESMEHGGQAEEGDAPLSEAEQTVADVWSELLGIEGLGRQANFFDLGGHSLLATQVITRIRNAFGLNVPIDELFEHATVADFAARLEAIRQTTSYLQTPVNLMSPRKVDTNAEVLPLTRKENLPLSFAQQRLWFLHCLEPESPAYNMPSALRVTGCLNLPVLHQSLNEIVRRHEVLRTIFAAVDGRPVQTVMQTSELSLRIVDLQMVEPDKREQQVLRLARAEAHRPFNLMRPPLLRVTVVKLSKDEQVVLFTMHHIVCDGWSVALLMKEVMRLYDAYSRGNPSTLSELAIQYGDFAVWQRQWLEGEALEEKLTAWNRQFGDKPPVLELPIDHQRKGDMPARAAMQKLVLSQVLMQTLRALSQSESATLFMTMLAAFECLLHRYSGQDDMVVGTAMANRNRSEIEELIGFFVNMLVVRTDLSGNPTFRQLLTRVREATLAAYALEDLPFEKLVEALRPDRNVASTSLLKLVFVHQNVPMTSFSLAGLTFTPLELASEMIHFDLMAEIVEGGEGLTIQLTYNTSLFNPETIARLLTHYEALLQSVVTEPERRLLDIPVLLTGAQSQPDVPSNLHHIYAQDHFAFGQD